MPINRILILLIVFNLVSCATSKKTSTNPEPEATTPTIIEKTPDSSIEDTEPTIDEEQDEEQNEDEFDLSFDDKTKELDAIEIQNASISKNITGRSEFSLNEQFKENDEYKFWLEYFTTREKELFQEHIHNGEKYRPLITATFNKFNIPEELYYVGLIESGYNTHIRSRARAVGPWQFIKGTALKYDLTVNSDIDERVSIYKSTEAAAKYFRDLYNIFGSWELALVAYNSGEYRVIRAIRNGNTRNLIELKRMKLLPRETRNYIPKILAARHIVENYKDYGFKIDKIEPWPTYPKFTIRRPTSLNNISKLTGLSANSLRSINPDIKSNHIRFSNYLSGFEIYLPEEYLAKLSSTSLKDRSPASLRKAEARHYTVRRGDNLISISNKTRTRLSKILMLNNLKISSPIYPGQKLVLNSFKKHRVYRVKRGDNLSTISEKFNVPISKLKKINKIKDSTLYVDSSLKIPL